jgi:hypothetical protein
MNRNEILNSIKTLDETNVYPYLYDVMTDGSAKSEGWLDELEERNLNGDNELIDALAEMRIV